MSDSIASRTRSRKAASFGANVSGEHASVVAGDAAEPVASTSRVDESVASTSRADEPVASTSRADEPFPSASPEDDGAPIFLDNGRRKRRKRVYTHHTDNVRISRSIYNKNYVDYLIENPNKIMQFGQFLLFCVPFIEDILRKELLRHRHIKCNFVMPVVFINVLDFQVAFSYRTRNDILVSDFDIDEFIADAMARLLSMIDEHQLSGGSGFTVAEISGLEVHCNKLKMLRPKSHIPLPKWLELKRAIVNPKNVDQQCFKHAVLSRHYTGTGKGAVWRARVARYEGLYNFDSISFPTPLSQVKKFARQNNMSINIYGVDKKHVYPIIVNKARKQNHVDLLYLSRGKKTHYTYIRNMSRLVRSQVTKHGSAVFFCVRCLAHFPRQVALEAHERSCDGEHLATLVLPPKEHSLFNFSKHDACQQIPLFLVCDLECMLLNVDTCGPNPKKSFTNELQRHQPVAFGSYLYSNIDTSHVPQLPLGYFDCISTSEKQLSRQMFRYFCRVARAAKLVLNADFPIHASQQAKKDHADARDCYVCGRGFSPLNPKVFDHSHYQKEFNTRGSCCNSCNLKMRKHRYVVVYFHNLKGYDGHMLIKMLSVRKLNIRVLAITLEKYLTFTVMIKGLVFRFQDSLCMLDDSLQVVSETLSNDCLMELKRNFSPELCELLHKKAPFPYSFLSCAANLKEKQFPGAKYFKNDLTGEDVSTEEYQRAREIFEKSGCVTFKDFTMVYLKSDVLLLVDCLIAARTLYWENFKVDMCAFLSLPHLSLQCMLKHTKITLELLDESMMHEYDLVRRSLYGGLTFSNVKYVECGDGLECFYLDAIGKYFNAFFFTFHLYLSLFCDVCRSLHWHYAGLPTSCRRLSHGACNTPRLGDSAHGRRVRLIAIEIAFSFNNFFRLGYLLEVDLHYPRECHDLLNSLPPLPIRTTPKGCLGERLINDLLPKTRYVLSLPYLQLALSLGAVLDKVHNVLQFRQKKFLENYIQKLCKLRQDAKSKYSNMLIKKFSNSLYGKFVERVDKRRDIRIVTQEKELEKLVRKGNFASRSIYEYNDAQFCIVELSKRVVVQNRPIIVGSQILAFAKIHMIRFYYEVIVRHLKSPILCYFDTDSILFSCLTEDLYQDLGKIKQFFDFSTLPKTHKLYSTENEKKFLYFKDESAGKRIKAFCSPRTKSYAILYEDSSFINKLKGVQRSFVQNKLQFDHYKRCVLEDAKFIANFNSIVAKKHTLFTVNINKLALESTDFKRVLCTNRRDTVAYGHYSLLDD